jgi:hypothetical protein
MEWSLRRCAVGAAARWVAWPLLAAVGVLTLAGCGLDGQPSVNAAQPRGASVAFESIDGPPTAQFNKLVQDLNEEAQARRLAVISRDKPSVYRVRGYLAAKVAKNHTTVSWVWDVFDQNEHRALRITGEETTKGRHRRGWTAADDAMLKRIASSSMAQLASFLTSPDVAPNAPAPAAPPQLALIGWHDTSPEAAGIFRIFRANADPVAAETEQAAEPSDAETSPRISGPVPLPRRRPPLAAAVSARETTITLAASGGASER